MKVYLAVFIHGYGGETWVDVYGIFSSEIKAEEFMNEHAPGMYGYHIIEFELDIGFPDGKNVNE